MKWIASREQKRTRFGRKLKRSHDVVRWWSDGGNLDSVSRVRRKHFSRIFADKQQRLRRRRRRHVCRHTQSKTRRIHTRDEVCYQQVPQSNVAETSTCVKYLTNAPALRPTWPVSGKSHAIGRVRPSVRLFPLYLSNQLTFDFNFFTCMGHDHSSPGLEVKVSSRSKVSAKKMCVLHKYNLLWGPTSTDWCP